MVARVDEPVDESLSQAGHRNDVSGGAPIRTEGRGKGPRGVYLDEPDG